VSTAVDAPTSASRRFRFRARYRGVAWVTLAVGGSLVGIGGIGLVLVPVIAGAVGVAFGATYLASPTWKLSVTVDDHALTVASKDRTRFTLAWADVKKVVASPSTHTCFVDGGAPERSLLVPGVGAPAPYDIEDKPALFEAILAHVPADKVETVDTLETAHKA
jgi:hypothetical protein